MKELITDHIGPKIIMKNKHFVSLVYVSKFKVRLGHTTTKWRLIVDQSDVMLMYFCLISDCFFGACFWDS